MTASGMDRACKSIFGFCRAAVLFAGLLVAMQGCKSVGVAPVDDATAYDDGFIAVAGPFALRVHPGGAVPDEGCEAVVGVRGGMLVMKAVAEDSHAMSRADKDNVKLWLKGDVLEFFVQPAGRSDYYEFHATPRGNKLQLHFGGDLGGRPAVFENLVFEGGLQVHSSVSHGMWHLEMAVPMESLGIEEASGSRVAIGRYNYGPSGEPELSASMVVEGGGGFHCVEQWHLVGK